MLCSHDVCVVWAHLRFANLEFVVHVGVKSVVSSSQPGQNNLLCPVQFVETAQWTSGRVEEQVGNTGRDVHVITHHAVCCLLHVPAT